MDSQTYWKNREAEQRKHNIRDEAEYQKRIQEIYQNMIDEIEKEINGFYGKYAKKEGITMAEAKKRAAKADIEALGRKAARYVKDKDFSQQANEEMRLYNMTMKVNRLELLKAQIGLEMVAGFDEMEKYFGEILTDRAVSEFERQAGILGKTIQNNAKAADAIVNASFHNADFRDRAWMYHDMLKAELSSLLSTGLIQGQNPRRLAQHIRKRFGVSQYKAERLMITELARVQTEAQKQSFERNGFTEYTFLALGNACEDCRKLDGKHFKVAKMMPGENAPPMHPFCRCSISAYEDSEDYEAWLDFLDKGGTTEEWNRLKNEEKSDKIQLTEDEKRALWEYKSFRSYMINEFLRKDPEMKHFPEEEKAFVQTLDSALSKMPKYQGNLIRTIDFSDWPDKERKVKAFLEEYDKGKTIRISQYWSTSKKGGYNKDADINIYILNAKNGRDISMIGLDESEVLYERKSAFMIISKKFYDGKWNILLKEE